MFGRAACLPCLNVSIYCTVVYLDESPDIGGQVDGTLRFSSAVRVTDVPVAVVTLRRENHKLSQAAAERA